MSTKTTNYALIKPALTDTADITAMNGNWDTIDSELKTRATLGSDGNIPSSQLPIMNYVPTTEEAAANGVATLDANGQVPASQLGNAASAPTGAASTIIDNNLTANRAVMSDGNGKIAVSPVSATELGYLKGVTSGVQTQLGAKVSKAGDELTGMLDFKNVNESKAISKKRLIGTTNYYANWGCGQLGGEGVVIMEVQLPSTSGGASTLLGKLEVGNRGVSFVDTNNKRTYLCSSGLTAASVES